MTSNLVKLCKTIKSSDPKQQLEALHSVLKHYADTGLYQRTGFHLNNNYVLSSDSRHNINTTLLAEDVFRFFIDQVFPKTQSLTSPSPVKNFQSL